MDYLNAIEAIEYYADRSKCVKLSCDYCYTPHKSVRSIKLKSGYTQLCTKCRRKYRKCYRCKTYATAFDRYWDHSLIKPWSTFRQLTRRLDRNLRLACSDCCNEYNKCSDCGHYTNMFSCSGFKVCRTKLCSYCYQHRGTCSDCKIYIWECNTDLEMVYQDYKAANEICSYHKQITSYRYGYNDCIRCTICVKELWLNPQIKRYFIQRNQADLKEKLLEELKHAPMPAQVKRKKILIADIKCRLVK